jgi:hypothetical protein
MHALRFRNLKTTWIGAVALVAAGFVPATASAQAFRFKVSERSSLAWWQMSPHLNHLWATTCPGEPSWQPGEERSSGWTVDSKRMPKTGHSNVVDTINVPVYPRPVASETCAAAVRGEITATDTVNWTGTKGLILVRGDQLITGLDMRDNYARKAVLQTSAFPDIKFQIDSLVNVRRSNDTLYATAIGSLELRAVRAPKKVQVVAWQEPLGLRVTAKFLFPSAELVEVFKMSRMSLGLGVGTGIWRYVHLGIDAILVPGTATSSE